MITGTPTTIFEADGFEQLLGAPSHRYFGDGFRRTRYDIASFQALVANEVSARAIARISYATDWSTKAGAGLLAPHLSTVDAAVLSAKMMEATLFSSGISSAQVGHAWIEWLSIRAGARPLESLETVPLTTKLLAQRASGDALVSTFDNRIGSFSVSARIRHPRPHRGKIHSAQLEMDGPLTAHYRAARHHTRIDALDASDQIIRCQHRVEPAVVSAKGLESAYWPGVMLIDCLVLAGQMAQALIYAGERVERSATGNLWMRRATFEAGPPSIRKLESYATMHVAGRTTTNRGELILNGVSVDTPDLFGVRVSADLAYFGSERTSSG